MRNVSSLVCSIVVVANVVGIVVMVTTYYYSSTTGVPAEGAEAIVAEKASRRMLRNIFRVSAKENFQMILALSHTFFHTKELQLSLNNFHYNLRRPEIRTD